jgi:hypothetical protein
MNYFWQTIGYGDVNPVTYAEVWVATLCQIFGSGLYAWVVGAVCEINASMDQPTRDFHTHSDSLTMFCQEQQIPIELGNRLREYFRQSKSVQEHKGHLNLLSYMSPGLRADVALKVSGPMILNIPFFNPPTAPRDER